MGCPAYDPVLIVKLLVLAFHYDLSDREVIGQAQVNVAFRLFLDLSMTSTLPHPTVLTKFRTRLGAEQFKALFEKVLDQARQQGLIKDRLRLKDATHLIADIAVPATIVLIAQMRERLLQAIAPFEASWVEQQQAEAVEIRTRTQDLKDEQRLLARVEQLRTIVNKGEEVAEQERKTLEAKGEQEDKSRLVQVKLLEERLQQGHKILLDREPGAKDKTISLVDEDARRGRHGEYYNGYLLDVSVDADSEIVTAIDVIAASADEAANTKNLIESEHSAHANKVEAVSIDSIGYKGQVLKALEDDEAGPQVKVYVPPHDRGKKGPERFSSEQFPVDPKTGAMSCPGEQQTQTQTRDKKRAGVIYSFKRSQCQNCPLKDQCLGGDERTGNRKVFKSDYEVQLVRARKLAQSEEYKQVRRQHPRVERKLADMIRYHGGRRVRYRRLARVRVQYFLTAMVVNIKRMVNILIPALQAQAA